MNFWVTVTKTIKKKNLKKKKKKKKPKCKIRGPHSKTWCIERERERETCKYGLCLNQHSRLLDILPEEIDP